MSHRSRPWVLWQYEAITQGGQVFENQRDTTSLKERA